MINDTRRRLEPKGLANASSMIVAVGANNSEGPCPLWADAADSTIEAEGGSCGGTQRTHLTQACQVNPANQERRLDMATPVGARSPDGNACRVTTQGLQVHV